MGGKALSKNTPRCGGLAIGASRWGLRRWDFAVAPPVLLVMCCASGALAPAARGRRDCCSGCFDALNFTELRCFLSTEIFGLSDAFKGGFRHRSLLRGEGGREKPDLIQQKCFDSILLCGNMGRVLFVFQCATKRTFKNLKTCDKMEYSPAAHATSMALNLDILLEKQPRSDPAVPLHFETSCLPLTSSKTSELLRARKSSFGLTSNLLLMVENCLFIKREEGQIRGEMRSPRRAHKKWPQEERMWMLLQMVPGLPRDPAARG